MKNKVWYETSRFKILQEGVLFVVYKKPFHPLMDWDRVYSTIYNFQALYYIQSH